LEKTKTIKIAENTHARLLNHGKAGDTFDNIINRLVTIADMENILLLYRITEKDPDNPREMHLKNPLYYWTEENYTKFFELASRMFSDWVEDIIRHIAKDEKLYGIVKKFRND
jgi:predicted CopG family antitoxin